VRGELKKETVAMKKKKDQNAKLCGEREREIWCWADWKGEFYRNSNWRVVSKYSSLTVRGQLQGKCLEEALSKGVRTRPSGNSVITTEKFAARKALDLKGEKKAEWKTTVKNPKRRNKVS